MRENEKRTKKLARNLRSRMTGAERTLWSKLRRDGLQGLRFRRQHPIGPYIADFACAPVKLVIEVDGGSHATNAGVRRDLNRTKYLEQRGWRVLRVWNDDIRNNLDGVMRAIRQECADAVRFEETTP